MTSPSLSYSGFGLPAVHTHPRPFYRPRRPSPYLHSNTSSSSSSSSTSSNSTLSSSSSSHFITALQSRSSSPVSRSSSPASRTPSPAPVPLPVIVHTCRRTPYYPPNSSRTAGNKTRVYLPRGPHYVANWTPLSTLSRGAQGMVEERMVLSLLF